MSGLLQRIGLLPGPLLPSFIIVGARKAGTSALFNMVAAHPDVLAPQIKELHFFNRDEEYRNGLPYYQVQFPLPEGWGRGKRTFEASVGYLQHPEVPQRIKWMLPEAHIVAILREPVSRAYSDWNMFRQFADHPRYAGQYDPRSFAEAVEDELADRRTPYVADYLAHGHYAPAIARYFQVFGRERVHLFSYGRFVRDPHGVVSEVMGLMGRTVQGIDPSAFTERANTRAYGTPMDPALKERLRAHCAPWQRELEDLIGSPFPLD